MATPKKQAEQPEIIVNPAETAQPSDATRCGGYVLTDQGWVLERPEVQEADDA